jgi:hypothetical protein
VVYGSRTHRKMKYGKQIIIATTNVRGLMIAGGREEIDKMMNKLEYI